MINLLCSECGAVIRFDTLRFGYDVTLEIHPCECSKACHDQCEEITETEQALAAVENKYQDLLSNIEKIIGEVSANE